MRTPVIVLSIALSCAALQAAQQQPPTFRSATRLVVETVTVLDRNGKPVEGLTVDDFTLTEDGLRQQIAFAEFQQVDASGATAPVNPPHVDNRQARGTPPHIATFPPGDIRYRNRRLLALYFDQSAMPPPDQMRAYTYAQRWMDTQMAPADLVAIMTFQGGAVRVKTDFTDNRAALREVITRLIFNDDLDGDGIPDNPDPGSAFGQDDAEFNVFNTDRQLAALQSAVTMLRALPEKKALIYFGSGLRLNGTDNQAQLRATVNAAIRANVSISPIDAKGLVAQAPLGDATKPSPGGIGVFNGQLAQAGLSAFQRSQDTLHALAKDTGGIAMFDYNDLSLGIARAARSITSYYIIGYYSTNSAADGRFRRVRLSVTSTGAIDLSYRQGYFADKEFARFSAADKERQLEEALLLENPITEVTMAVEVNYFQLNRAEYFVPVAVKMPGRELALARRRGAARTEIDIIAEVKDDYGVTIQNARDRLDIRLTAETAAELAKRPIQYETGFTLLPGKYVVKILVRDRTTGRIGTYQTLFTIPNLNRETERLPTSSVVLSSQRVPLTNALYNVKQRVAVETANPLVFDGQKLIPSVTRVFSVNRDMYVFLQAYQRDVETPRPLIAFVGFYLDDKKAFETMPLPVTGELDPRTKAVSVRFSFPLQGLSPGRYDCQVTLLDPSGRKVAFWRAPVFLISN
jgi:VWFA-related protein